jgi:hypothetical protein
MLRTPDFRFLFAVSVVSTLLLAPPALAQHGWPVQPGNVDHPMGQGFGEYQSTHRQHVGIDMMELPMYDASGNVNSTAPWVIVTVAGDVESLDDLANYIYNFTKIDPTLASNPAIYWYGHLQGGSYHADYVNAYNNGTAVAAGDEIARIVRWSWCSPPFHHVHYQLKTATHYLNPLADITPNPDADPPEIEDLHFAQDNSDPWVPFNPVAGGACTVVSGLTDILVKARDRDDAGASLGGHGYLWVYDMRWRACPDNNPNCGWQSTRPFDDIPHSWYTHNNAATRAQFSTRAPWISSSSYCDAPGWDYAIVTNYVAGTVNDAGNWNTTAISDGSYSVSVELTDFAGNTTVLNGRACVQNSATCTTELTIRDWKDDYGAIPYEGPHWWVSPDITANRGTSDEDQNILLDTDNPIEIQVWNNGSCALPAGTTYDVCLGWGLPSASVTHPLPASQQISCTTETVGSGGWAVGSSRTTTITWHPNSTQVPLGHHCLVAWVDKPPDDPVRNTPAVNQDDNRAQQNITFSNAPSPGVPGYTSFWFNPQEMMRNRSLALTFRYSRNRPTIRWIRLHIPPELVFKEITGGSVEGGYRGETPRDRCDLEPEDLHRLLCTPWEKGGALGLSRVIGGIDPNGRLLLEGIENVREPLRLILEVWSEENVRQGEFADIEIVEHGILEGHEVATPVGGLTVRIEH